MRLVRKRYKRKRQRLVGFYTDKKGRVRPITRREGQPKIQGSKYVSRRQYKKTHSENGRNEKKLKEWWNEMGYLERIDKIFAAYSAKYGEKQADIELEKFPLGLYKLNWDELPNEIKNAILWYEFKYGKE